MGIGDFFRKAVKSVSAGAQGIVQAGIERIDKDIERAEAKIGELGARTDPRGQRLLADEREHLKRLQESKAEMLKSIAPAEEVPAESVPPEEDGAPDK